jgi:putative SOS response-associated peptidase YedK
VTTKGNKMLAKIHNNPILEGPRMPVILPQELEDKWLNPIEDELDIKSIQELIREYPDEELDAYTVRRLRGKEYIGNVEEVSEPYEYEKLKI